MIEFMITAGSNGPFIYLLEGDDISYLSKYSVLDNGDVSLMWRKDISSLVLGRIATHVAVFDNGDFIVSTRGNSSENTYVQLHMISADATTVISRSTEIIDRYVVQDFAINPTTGYVSICAATSTTGTEQIYSYNSNLDLQWSEYSNSYVNSPVIVGDYVYFGSSNDLVEKHYATGVRNTYPLGNTSSMAGAGLCYHKGDGAFYAVLDFRQNDQWIVYKINASNYSVVWSYVLTPSTRRQCYKVEPREGGGCILAINKNNTSALNSSGNIIWDEKGLDDFAQVYDLSSIENFDYAYSTLASVSNNIYKINSSNGDYSQVIATTSGALYIRSYLSEIG